MRLHDDNNDKGMKAMQKSRTLIRLVEEASAADVLEDLVFLAIHHVVRHHRRQHTNAAVALTRRT